MDLFRQLDIARAARSMIEDFGPHAADKAAAEASKARLQNRSTAEVTWKQIEQEIRHLQMESGGDT